MRVGHRKAMRDRGKSHRNTDAVKERDRFRRLSSLQMDFTNRLA